MIGEVKRDVGLEVNTLGQVRSSRHHLNGNRTCKGTSCFDVNLQNTKRVLNNI